MTNRPLIWNLAKLSNERIHPVRHMNRRRFITVAALATGALAGIPALGAGECDESSSLLWNCGDNPRAGGLSRLQL